MKRQDIQLKVPGLDGAVVIHFDRVGMPHIQAESQRDAYFAQGYVVAEARRWQLDLYRRTAGGWLAECFGTSAIHGDRFQRKLALQRLSAEKTDKLADDVRERIESYAQGVNYWTDSNPLPGEFKILGLSPVPWTLLDSMLIAELRSVINASWRADLILLQAMEKADPEKVKVLFANYRMPDSGAETLSFPGFDNGVFKECLDVVRESEAALKLLGLQHSDSGTNTWVVDGRRTRHKKPLLANDLHMGYVAPNPNFLVHLKAPGLNVRGICFPGMPGVLVGHNDRIAWGASAFMADSQDLFIEEFNKSGDCYKFRDQWLPVDINEEVIRVRGGKDVVFKVKRTHHGAIVFEEGQWGLALCWERLNLPPGDPTFHQVNTAHDWNSFREAFRYYTGPSNDFSFADVDGNIGMQAAGRVPIRAGGDGALPAVGRDGRYEWIGYIDFDDLPTSYNPDCGFIVRSNQAHSAGHGHFHFSHRWHPPYRARRIKRLLTESSIDHSVEGLSRIQLDRFSCHGEFLCIRIMDAIRDIPLDGIYAEARELVKRWDYRLTPDSIAASIIKECSAVIKSKLIAPLLGKSLFFAYQQNWPSANVAVEWILGCRDPKWIPEGIADYEILSRSVFQAAVDNLQKSFGPEITDSWAWGGHCRAGFPHPLEQIPWGCSRFAVPLVEVGSDGECVFSSRSVGDYISAQQSVMMDPKKGRVAIFGTSGRFIYDLGDWDNSSLLLNLGQSGDPNSPYYRDQLELWRIGTTLKLPFAWETVEKASVRRILFIKDGPTVP